jgi:LemA protein
MIGTIILIAVVVIIIGIIVGLYNSLVRLKNEVENSWAQIDVQLKRRTDLIPNLINTVKGYMKHEREVLENITKARSALVKADSVKEKAKAENQLENTLKSLFAVSENYPQLKANENFMKLQEELSSTENKIAYARQHYNDMVMYLNNKIEQFPSNMVASMFSFKEKELFEVDEKDRKPVKVNF